VLYKKMKIALLKLKHDDFIFGDLYQ